MTLTLICCTCMTANAVVSLQAQRVCMALTQACDSGINAAREPAWHCDEIASPLLQVAQDRTIGTVLGGQSPFLSDCQTPDARIHP